MTGLGTTSGKTFEKWASSKAWIASGLQVIKTSHWHCNVSNGADSEFIVSIGRV